MTYSQRFSTLVAAVLKTEGGYVNNINDPGGATNLGVTQRVYDAYRSKQGLSTQSVRYISTTEAESIYYHEYYLPIDADSVKDDCVADILFDVAVNSGVSRAKQFYSECSDDPDALLTARETFYREIVQNNPKEVVFLKGWLARLNNIAVAYNLTWRATQT